MQSLMMLAVFERSQDPVHGHIFPSAPEWKWRSCSAEGPSGLSAVPPRGTLIPAA